MRISFCAIAGIAVLVMCGAAHAAVKLDSTFGTGGKVVETDIGPSEIGKILRVAADGRIVTAGAINTANRIVIRRYQSDGSQDPGFAQNGTFVLEAGNNVELSVSRLFLYRDGRVLVVGWIRANGEQDLFGLRLQPNGDKDHSFGNHGFTQWDVAGGSDEASGLVVDDTGRIFVAGSSGKFISMVRVLPNGRIDREFGSGGRVITDLENLDEAAVDISIANDRVYLAARTINSIGVEGCSLLRYFWSGRIDRTFAADRHIPLGNNQGMRCTQLLDQSDGKLLAFGEARQGGGLYLAARAMPDGTLDTSFNDDGVVAITTPMDGKSFQVFDMALAPDNSLVFGGTTGGDQNSTFDYWVASVNDSGLPNATWNSSGTMIVDFNGKADLARSVAVDTQGRVLAAGEMTLLNNSGGFGIMRLIVEPEAQRPIAIEKELMIIDSSVVGSNEASQSGGRWRFAHLATQLAPPAKAKEFVKSWLASWRTDQSLNGLTAPARPRVDQEIIAPWKCADGQTGVSDDQWVVNLENAPFRLSAIVYRPDLSRRQTVNGVLEPHPEGRFVFDVFGRDAGTCQITGRMSFTLILEYGLPLDNLSAGQWAQRWHALGELPFGDEYNSALLSLTESFVVKGAAPNKPNQNALNQLRTNEIALNGPWELREFNIDGGSGMLVNVSVKESPHVSRKNQAVLRTYLEENQDGILAGVPLPVLHAADPMIGVNSLADGVAWNAPGLDPALRNRFALNTCDGCHQSETNTAFIHVGDLNGDGTADLSQFTQNDLALREQIMLRLLEGKSGKKNFEKLLGERAGRVH